MIYPVHDNILIKVDTKPKENKTASGIILTHRQDQEKDNVGIVVATGEGRILPNGDIVPCSVKENQRIIFTRFSGSEIVENDITYLIIKENDILAIVE